MGEDIAAANVNRTYILSGTNIAIFTFMLFFLYPRFESSKISPSLFQFTLIVMGVAAFSFVFATLIYYRCSLSGRMSVADSTLYAVLADRCWLLGYTMMFLAPSLVLFLVGLLGVASVWLGLWVLYVFFAIRYFPKVQTERGQVRS